MNMYWTVQLATKKMKEKKMIPPEHQLEVLVYVRPIAPKQRSEWGDIGQYFAPERLIKQGINSIVHEQQFEES